MTIFTWLMDLATNNAFALIKMIELQNSSRFTLLQEQRRQKESLDDIVGLNTSLHIITPNSTAHSNGKLQCYLGNLRGIKKKSKSRYGILRRSPPPRHTQRSHTDQKTPPAKIDIGHIEPRSRTRKIDDSTVTRRSE
ncbi:Hypothetical protein PHPALM_608 [Phytophthora palmivora]|uniref:Uncharacterized protein n=1 Tax=Phytophthora palmivora TaxID=4796 RepID=A0A2P4YUE6_9STRA|nr:Hypothetical protein PHPALM_608 [Phytophthora palmivora]